MRVLAAAVTLLVFCGSVCRAEEAGKKPWSVEGNVSYSSSNGDSDADTLGAKLLYEGTYDPHRYFLDGLVLYGKTDGEKTSEREEVNARYERDFTKRAFGFAEGQYLRNPFIGFDARYAGGPGLGYHFIRAEDHELKGLASVLWVYENQPGEGNANSHSSWKLAADYRHELSSLFNLKAHLDYSENFGSLEKYLFNSETVLESRLNENLLFFLSYLYQYRHQPNDSDPGGIQRTFLIGLEVEI